MISGRALISRLAPLLACLGLLGVWQAAALILSTDSFPTALEALGAIPSILGDKESLINILASIRRMAIGFGVAIMVSIPLGLMMGRSRRGRESRQRHLPRSSARYPTMRDGFDGRKFETSAKRA